MPIQKYLASAAVCFIQDSFKFGWFPSTFSSFPGAVVSLPLLLIQFTNIFLSLLFCNGSIRLPNFLDKPTLTVVRRNKIFYVY